MSSQEGVNACTASSMTRRQLVILVFLCYGNFWNNACYSLIGPFYPKVAEKKGATPTQYGLIFSIYQFMYLITSPLFAKSVASLSPSLFCSIGLLIEGFVNVLFGYLVYIPNGTPFIALSFALRMIGGISSAVFLTASFTIVVKEFPEKTAQTFSLTATSLGIGLILGPFFGGFLYQWGGFVTPFAILGGFQLLGAILCLILMPKTLQTSAPKSINFWRFIFDIGILLDALVIMVSTNFFGFNAATLEPHLRQFNLEPIVIGIIFIISGVVYALTTNIWGNLCDKGYNPRKICLFGCISSMIGFLFIGPQEFIAIDSNLWLIVFSLVLIGLGSTSKLIASFVSALNEAINRRGFPDDLSTYSMVSAIYLCAYSVGAIVGPILGGLLIEEFGYRRASFVLLVPEMVLVFLLLIYLLVRKVIHSFDAEKQPLLKT